MTTMVLTMQNGQGRHAEQRSHLGLQVNLLAEQKIAKLIALLEELRRDLPIVRDRKDSIAEAMAEQFNPHAVISALEATFQHANAAAPTKVSEVSPSIAKADGAEPPEPNISDP